MDPDERTVVIGGAAHLGSSETWLERGIFEELTRNLRAAGYLEIGVPSLISRATVERQGAVPWEEVLRVDEEWALAGSAEQGILERYAGQEAAAVCLFALNQCFRKEASTEGLMRLREFRKLELYGFQKTERDARDAYGAARELVARFMTRQGLKTRWVDVTERDPGYHKTKWDLETWTERYGWMETHSAAYYGTEHSDRFGIKGARYSWCSTGVASPRILIPLLEMIGRSFP